MSCRDAVSFCQGIWKNLSWSLRLQVREKKIPPATKPSLKLYRAIGIEIYVLILIVLAEKALCWWFLRLSGYPLPSGAAESWGRYRSHSSARLLPEPAGQELFSSLYITYGVLLHFHESWSVSSVKPYFITQSALATPQEKSGLGRQQPRRCWPSREVCERWEAGTPAAQCGATRGKAGDEGGRAG